MVSKVLLGLILADGERGQRDHPLAWATRRRRGWPLEIGDVYGAWVNILKYGQLEVQLQGAECYPNAMDLCLNGQGMKMFPQPYFPKEKEQGLWFLVSFL